MKRLALLLLSALMIAIVPVSLAAATTYNVCTDPGAPTSTKTSAYCLGQTATNPISGPNGILIQVANIIAVLAGMLLVIMMIIAGLRYVTSSGDSAGVEKAKNTILHLLTGLIIIVLARVLVAFVVSRI